MVNVESRWDSEKPDNMRAYSKIESQEGGSLAMIAGSIGVESTVGGIKVAGSMREKDGVDMVEDWRCWWRGREMAMRQMGTKRVIERYVEFEQIHFE